MPKNVIISFIVSLCAFEATILIGYLRSRKKKKVVHREDPNEIEFIHEASERSNSIIHRALKQADRILADAELQAISLIARQKLDSKTFGGAYKEQLRQLGEETKQNLAISTEEAEKSLHELVNDIETQMRALMDRNQKVLTDKTQDFFDKSHQSFSSFTELLKNKLKTDLENDMAKARETIQAYQRQRMAAIDDHIVDIVEKTVKVALKKSLSLSEQTDLVYEALNQAKKESVFDKQVKESSS